MIILKLPFLKMVTLRKKNFLKFFVRKKQLLPVRLIYCNNTAEFFSDHSTWTFTFIAQLTNGICYSVVI